MKTRIFAVTIAVLIALGLKQHYAVARSDDLWWILRPTVELVEVMTSTAFTMEPGEGYFSRERLFLIEKSCAGINFLVAAFGMLVFVRRHDITSGASGARTLAVAFLASCVATLVVNALRISIALWLAASPLRFTSLDPAALHRLEGIVIYFAGLLALHEAAQWLETRAIPAESRR